MNTSNTEMYILEYFETVYEYRCLLS